MRFFTTFACSLFLTTSALADHGPIDGHLTFERGALHAHLQWVTPPKENKEAVLGLQWMNGSTHTPTEADGTLSAALWMPSMGHGSSPVTIQRVLDSQGNPSPGAFRISRMFFLMSGAWEVRFTLTKTDGSQETQTWPVSLASEENWQ